jgi:hypothetical protein
MMSQYDAATDQGVTAIHRELIGYVSTTQPLARGETPEQIKFYLRVRLDISSLLLRARSIPQNTLTVEQIQILNKLVDELDILDQEGFTAAEAQLVRDAIDRTCQAILKLEIAKKR